MTIVSSALAFGLKSMYAGLMYGGGLRGGRRAWRC